MMDDSYDEARTLAEEALGFYARGERDTADRMVERAAELDRSAVEDVVRELDEDADARGLAHR